MRKWLAFSIVGILLLSMLQGGHGVIDSLLMLLFFLIFDRKGHVVVGLLVLALLVAGAVLASGPSRGGQETGTTTTVTVSAGQTLWDIAAATGRGDVMETAALIVELNHLSGTTLRPGQRLIVPRG